MKVPPLMPNSRRAYLTHIALLLLVLSAATAKEGFQRYGATTNPWLEVLFVNFLSYSFWSMVITLCAIFLYNYSKRRFHSRLLSMSAIVTIGVTILLPIANIVLPKGRQGPDLFDKFCAAIENPSNRDAIISWANEQLQQHGTGDFSIPRDEIPQELIAVRPRNDAFPVAMVGDDPGNPSRLVLVNYYISRSTCVGLVVGWEDVATFPKAVEKTRTLHGGIIAFEDTAFQ